MAVLSHGDDGKVFGTDGEMAIKKLVEPLKNCKSLVGKPKLFVIQVCVRTKINDGSLYIYGERFVLLVTSRMASSQNHCHASEKFHFTCGHM